VYFFGQAYDCLGLFYSFLLGQLLGCSEQRLNLVKCDDLVLLLLFFEVMIEERSFNRPPCLVDHHDIVGRTIDHDKASFGGTLKT